MQSGTIDRLQDELDTVLVSRGFAAGQVGVAYGHREIVWCAAAGDFAARFPGLPASQEPAEGWGTMCTDVVVRVTSVSGQWRVAMVSVEGDDLDQVFTGLGLTSAASRATALIGATAENCLISSPLLLIELLDGPSTKR
jgi:hypothetical protein